MAKFDYFNLLGPIYDLIFSLRNSSKLVEMVNLFPQQALLDIGGGTGRVSEKFSGISSSIIVADPAIKMLREAHKKGLLIINANSEALPLRTASFERVMMIDAFHHVAQHQLTLDEIWRVLKPGGRLVIEEPNIRNIFGKFIAIGEKILLMRSKIFTPEEIISMCSFQDVENVRLEIKDALVWVMIDKRAKND